MCGIAGIYRHAGGAIDRQSLIAMRDAMAERGPDGFGIWQSSDHAVGLAHRRLAIIDLSDRGAQPMASQDGRLRIVFNGEIYNYRELRSTLESSGCKFVTDSDTEVLLALYAHAGSGFVEKLRGMFAFALWDDERKGILLARDAFGIKPLYYANDSHCLRFASQVKALLAGGEVDDSPDPAGYAGYCIFGSVPEPFTLYRGIHALAAGTTLWIDRDGVEHGRAYWDLAGKLAASEITACSPNHEQLGLALQDSVKHHMVSDVPVGVFLSAGLDSTMLAALASAGNHSCAAITLSFPEYDGTENDELGFARETARQFGMRHHVCRITRDEFQAHADRLLCAMDQPTIDGVNSYFVSLAAREAGFKVALSGLGGDEWFAGYPSFGDVPRIAALPQLPVIGRMLRKLTAVPVSRFTSPKYASLLEYGGSFAGAYLLRRALHMPWEVDQLLEPGFAADGLRELHLHDRLEQTIAGIASDRLRVTALELSWYMRNQLLRDADWAGMAHSVEIRVPFVDTTFASRISGYLSRPDAPGKRALAQSLPVVLPQPLLDRPKTGFSVPVREWLIGDTPGSGSGRGLRQWSKLVLQRLAAGHAEVWAR